MKINSLISVFDEITEATVELENWRIDKNKTKF